MKLAEIQTALFALTSGEVAPSPERVGFIAGSGGVSSQRRVEVYADAILAKAAHALGVPFRKLASFLGERRFVELLEAHRASRPPAQRTIVGLVRELPEFLAREPSRWGRADLGDLAALELARHEVFLDAASSVAGPEALASLPERCWPSATLHLVPAVRIVRLAYDVAPLWQCLDEGITPPPPAAAATSFLVWRRGLQVFHSVLPATEACALERAIAGAPLPEVCAAFDGEAAPADAAYAALYGWLTDGLVAAVTTVPDRSGTP
jgi:putative DNA-binding protein